ncbi:MAG: CBS domain-containing protein [Rhodospirillales bacterium]|jgi:CBS domain-containing protein|nr:CBS domain-containing protein [Rhodospirillales bacterium]
MKITQILEEYGSKPVTVPTHTTIGPLSHRLKLERTGSVIISNDGNTVEGIITARDIVRALSTYGAELIDVPVTELMIKDVHACKHDDDAKTVMHRMSYWRVRYLPVMDGGKLVGVVNIRDLVKSCLIDAEMETNVLRDFIVAAS